MLSSLEDLYNIFRKYPKPLHDLSCKDNASYDSDQIALILSYNLRELPYKLVERLEFFGDSWGTTDEVKYYLPRKLECTAIYFLHLCIGINNKSKYDSHFHLFDQGFFSYKLSEMNSWPLKEQNVICNFIYSIFEFLVNNSNSLNEFIEDYCCHLPLDGKHLAKIWDGGMRHKKHQQFISYLEKYFLEQYNRPKNQLDVCIGEFNITQWIISDAHSLEFDF